MGLINKDGFYNLVTYEGNVKREFMDGSLVWLMRQNIVEEYDYYYLEFKLKDSFDVFPVDTFIPKDILERIRRSELYLMVVNYHESFISIVEGIYESLIKRDNIPAQQIILGSGNYDIYDEVHRVSCLTGYPEIRVEWFLELEYAQKQRKLSMSGELPTDLPCQPSTLNTLELKDYTKKYLNFNRRWRLHRPTMVALLNCFNLLDKGYVSLGESDDNNNWQTMWTWVKTEAQQNYDISKMFTQNEEKILSIGNLYIDTDDLVTNRAWLDNDTDYLYNNTYFSLVSETNYYSDRKFDGGRFITEKTFKAITCEHPFILATLPNTLPLLHQLGYKTFSPWIDESYDSETDDYKRMLLIVKEVQRLCNLSGEDLRHFLVECKKIVNHNIQNLMNKKNWIYKMNYK